MKQYAQVDDGLVTGTLQTSGAVGDILICRDDRCVDADHFNAVTPPMLEVDGEERPQTEDEWLAAHAGHHVTKRQFVDISKRVNSTKPFMRYDAATDTFSKAEDR